MNENVNRLYARLRIRNLREDWIIVKNAAIDPDNDGVYDLVDEGTYNEVMGFAQSGKIKILEVLIAPATPGGGDGEAGPSTTRTVNTIAERNDLTEVSEGETVMVLDATGDSTVMKGYAQYLFHGGTWIKMLEEESMDVDVLTGPISATEVTETSERQFIPSSKKSQIDSNTSELASHSMRLNDLEQLSQGMQSNGKVKLNSLDEQEGYLEEKIDGSTIQVSGGKLSVSGINGLFSTLAELNYLQGVTENVQAQINALNTIGNFSTSVNTHADLMAIETPEQQDMVIVLADETKENASTIYIYNSTEWMFAGEFKGGEIRDFAAKPIDLSLEVTGLLPKAKYEKQDASETPFADNSGSLVSTNVKDALLELFQKSNDIKSRVASIIGSPLSASDTISEMMSDLSGLKEKLAQAIINKGIGAYSYNTFEELINKIKSIPNVKISGGITSTSKINVTSPYTHNLLLDEPLQIEDIATTVLQYVGNDTGVVHYSASYNNGESNSFDYDPDEVVFDGFMNLKDRWVYPMQVLEEDVYYETEEIKFSDFNDFNGDLNVNVKSETVGFGALKSHGTVVKANGDISLLGVETLDKINLTSVVSGNGVSKLALSFDGGVVWHAFNGTLWVNVNVEDEGDFKTNGMDPAVVNGLTNKELSEARGENNLIRFAYYLERPVFEDVAKNDKIELSVSMLGYNIIAPTSNYNYSYDSETRTLTYEFLVDGTYTINYVDGL